MRKTAMNFMRAAAVAAALTLGGGLGGAALAASQTEEASASWSSPAIERVGQMLCGTWHQRRGARHLQHDRRDGEPGPVDQADQIEGIPDAMYCRRPGPTPCGLHRRRSSSSAVPGQIRLRTFEFHNANVEKAAFIGAGRSRGVPHADQGHFIATLDIEGMSPAASSADAPRPYRPPSAARSR